MAPYLISSGPWSRVGWAESTVGSAEVGQFSEMGDVYHMSNEKNPGWLGYLGDEILPSYIGIVINHEKDPY